MFNLCPDQPSESAHKVDFVNFFLYFRLKVFWTSQRSENKLFNGITDQDFENQKSLLFLLVITPPLFF